MPIVAPRIGCVGRLYMFQVDPKTPGQEPILRLMQTGLMEVTFGGEDGKLVSCTACSLECISAPAYDRPHLQVACSADRVP